MIKLSDGTEYKIGFSVVDTLGRNGHANPLIIKKGYGGCWSKDGDTWINFTYTTN